MAEPTSKTEYRGTSREEYGRGGATGKTEEGYTNVMKKNILSTEASIRREKDEQMHVFDSKGNKVVTFQGKGAEVRFDASRVPENSIITHNHPRSLGQTGIRSFGNSFSSADVFSAVKVNAKEMRAVTPTYTFSIKRPEKGWGNLDKIKREYNKITKELVKENRSYIGKASTRVGAYRSRVDRAEVTHYHEVMSRLAKKMGWGYTKKKG